MTAFGIQYACALSTNVLFAGRVSNGHVALSITQQGVAII